MIARYPTSPLGTIDLCSGVRSNGGAIPALPHGCSRVSRPGSLTGLPVALKARA